MNEEIRWPKKGDNPFHVKYVDPNSPTWASLHWLASLNINDSFFANAFKEAADKIIKELSRGEEPWNHDTIFMPIAYLYRHGLELKMKHLIKMGIELDLLKRDDKVSSALGSHKLHQLWNYLRKIVEGYWPEGQKEVLDATGRIIQEFHNIDKTGQNLRYSEDSSGKESLNGFPEFVQLTDLNDVIDAVFNFLEGCEAGFDHALEMRNDMMREFSDNY
ncbi:MAG: hypothetical protein ABSA04_11320 [Desulfobaccales bacterium]|jgi:hypothetical protein